MIALGVRGDVLKSGQEPQNKIVRALYTESGEWGTFEHQEDPAQTRDRFDMNEPEHMYFGRVSNSEMNVMYNI
jgi:hypothetical protein